MTHIQNTVLGKELARALMQKPHGKRAVTLVGNSMGARVIMKAMSYLYHLRELKISQLEEAQGKDGMDKKKESGGGWFSSSSEDKKRKEEENLLSTMSVEDFDTLVQDVVLLGTPSTIREEKWRNLRALVSGRVINGYSESDMVLSMVYRYERWQVKVAGVAPVLGELQILLFLYLVIVRSNSLTFFFLF